MKVVKKFIAIVFVMSLCDTTQAQWHDKNWVFGGSNLVTFFDNDSVASSALINSDSIFNSNQNFNQIVYTAEQVSCISDETGRLQFFNNSQAYGNNSLLSPTIPYERIYFKNATNAIDSIKGIFNSDASTTNGSIILPIDSAKYLYLFLKIVSEDSIDLFFNLHLYYHLIEKNDSGFSFIKKSVPLFTDFYLTEKLKAIKHPNGRDWWIIIQEDSDTTINNCTNTVAILHISKDSLVETKKQSVGIERCGLNNHVAVLGEIATSKKGDKIAMAYYDGAIDVFDFDRCKGIITSSKTYALGEEYLFYGLEFSPDGKVLYTTTNVYLNNNLSRLPKLYQINLLNDSIKELLVFDGSGYQMERGPDDKLYFGFNGPILKDTTLVGAQAYLHCIENPNELGLACNINLFKVKLLDNDFYYWRFGLPNFPNYRLPSLTIFETEAGSDTLICTDDSSSQKLVQLGSPTINGVTYQWYPNYNLSSDTTAQPMAFPDSTTMYYVMLSDTSIKNACKTRLDSVLVEVKNCVTGINDPQTPKGGLRVYPNPAREEINLSINNLQSSIKEVKVYDVAGRTVHSQLSAVHSSVTKINVSGLEEGLYFIEVMLSNGSVERVKFIKQ